MERPNSWARRIAVYGGIAVFVIMALEVAIVHIRPVDRGTAWKDVPTPDI